MNSERVDLFSLNLEIWLYRKSNIKHLNGQQDELAKLGEGRDQEAQKDRDWRLVRQKYARHRGQKVDGAQGLDQGEVAVPRKHDEADSQSWRDWPNFLEGIRRNLQCWQKQRCLNHGRQDWIVGSRILEVPWKEARDSREGKEEAKGREWQLELLRLQRGRAEAQAHDAERQATHKRATCRECHGGSRQSQDQVAGKV